MSHVCILTVLGVFHRDNLAPQESGVQRAHRDREERPVIRAELDQLASGLIYDFTYESHHKEVMNEATLWYPES